MQALFVQRKLFASSVRGVYISLKKSCCSATIGRDHAKKLSAARWDEDMWDAAIDVWADDDGNISTEKWNQLVLVQHLFEWIDIERRDSVDLDGQSTSMLVTLLS